MPVSQLYPTRLARLFVGRAGRRAAALTPVLGATTALLVAACGGGGSDSPTSPGTNTGGNQTISSVAISPSATSVVVGGTIALSASATNSSGSAVTATFTWSSSSAAVASVGASTGVVTGIAAGTATITATAGGVSATRVITVTAAGPAPPPPQSANIDMPGAAFVPAALTIGVGGTVSFAFSALAHNVFFGGGAGTPANIPTTSNAVVQRTFPTAGTFTITCMIHAGMNGVITVQ